MIKRDVLAKIMPWVGKQKILIIKGSRQVGKTTLLRQIEQDIKSRNPQAVIAYLAADDLDNVGFFKSADALFLYLQQQYGFPNDFVYLMIDEFQTIPQAGLFLKNIFDRYKEKLQLIVSGSSSLEITKNSEFLTGRALAFTLGRISFSEFVNYRYQLKADNLSVSKWHELELWQETFGRTLALAFAEYMLYGGYPEVVTTKEADNKKTILKSIVDVYIEKDIVHFLKIENVVGFNGLIRLLAAQTGQLVNVNELSNTLGLSIATVKKYLAIIEGTYVANLLHPFSTNRRVEITKMPKIFMLDLGLRNYLLRRWSVEAVEQGALVENFVYLALVARMEAERIKFYRTISGAEVDFIIEDENGKLILCEAKYRQKVAGASVAMNNMERRYQDRVQGKVVVTKETLAKKNGVFYIPATLFPIVELEFKG